MPSNIKSFYDTEIAMLEHEAIAESKLLEWRPEDAQWYLAGIHDFAERIIEKIREKEGF